MRLREANGPLKLHNFEGGGRDGGTDPAEPYEFGGEETDPTEALWITERRYIPDGNFENLREKNRPGGEWRGRWCISQELRDYHSFRCVPTPQNMGESWRTFYAEIPAQQPVCS